MHFFRTTKNFLLLFVLLVSTLPVCAQGFPRGVMSAWFRNSSEKWVRAAAHMRVVKLPSLPRQKLTPMSLDARMGKTLSGWLYARIGKSQLFSRQAKEILTKEFPKNPQVVSSRARFILDRDTFLKSNLEALYPNEKILLDASAFSKFQTRLEEAIHAAEEFALLSEKDMESVFCVAPVFPKELVKEVILSQQPRFFVMDPSVLQSFASQPTLEAQREFVQRARSYRHGKMQNLLIQGAEDLSKVNHLDFLAYLKFQQQDAYLAIVEEVLAQSQTRLNSLIVRGKQPLPPDTPFFPGDVPLTDAQRLGYIRYHKERLESLGAAAPQGTLKKLEALLKDQEATYGSYAVAESLGLPYERVLHNSGNPLNNYLPKPTTASSKDPYWDWNEDQKLAYTEKRMQEARQDKESLRQAIAANPTNWDYYAQYYRASSTEGTFFYQNLLLKNQLVDYLRGNLPFK